jgi:hypothetical protein
MKLLQIFLHTTLRLVSLPTDAEHIDSYPVKGTRAIGHCTPEEDAMSITVVANTYKKKWGKKYKTNCAAIAALVPGRTKNSVGVDGMMSWIAASTERVDARVNGQKAKSSSSMMRYKGTVARIGPQLPRWFRAERNSSVVADGLMFWMPTSVE